MAAKARLAKLLAQDRMELHELAWHEHYRQRSGDSSTSVSVGDIDAMDAPAFVNLVQALLRRDGFETTRLERDGMEGLVSVTCARGHRIVFSAHRVRGPHGWRPDPAEDVGTPDLHTVRVAVERFPCDDLVLVTNGGFSAPARRYAEDHDMCLWDRRDLRRWAEWEEPAACVGGHDGDAT
ncbi:restriction endonuclease [Streptomyces sp. NPDC051776]|uniref:restriction endonuclease n=1 Tax=Streptomyces sp. NPDC051776 TaxID=3155414 RepID=UPI00342F133C